VIGQVLPSPIMQDAQNDISKLLFKMRESCVNRKPIFSNVAFYITAACII
jgi:hypothetical protein